MTQHQYMSRQEAALALAVSVDVVDRLIATGALDRYRLHDRYIRVRRSQVEELSTVDRRFLELS